MHPDDQEASDLIRSGAYFEQSRKWYKVLYIGPIAERSFFLIVAGLAALIGIVGFFAFIGLMPVTDRPPILLSNPRIDDAVPSAIRLREGKESVNDALRRYYVIQYVISRESYALADFPKNSRFVMAYSDPTTSEAYAAAVGPSNPRNPAALLGAYGNRVVNIQSVHLDTRNDPQSATVKFSTELVGTITAPKTQWTATLQFHYSDAVVADATDPETGEETVALQEPTFQVVNYALSQN